MNHFTGSKQMPGQKLEEFELSKVRLVSPKDAGELINRAYELTRIHPQLRVGQNLWNYVNEDYPDVAALFHGGEYDFFYQPNAAVAVETFLIYYVEK